MHKTLSSSIYETPFGETKPSARPNGFYVYLHRKLDTQEVFYVGLGHNCRAWRFHSRNKHWKRTAIKHGVTVEIVKDQMSKLEAAELEVSTIAKYGIDNLTNYSTGGDYGRNGVRPVNIRAVECSNGMSFASAAEGANWVSQKTARKKAEGGAIIACCRQRIKSAYGFDWRYAGDTRKLHYVSREDRIGKSHSRKVMRSDGKLFPSGAEAGRWMHKHEGACKECFTAICLACRTGRKAYGYTWKYVGED